MSYESIDEQVCARRDHGAENVHAPVLKAESEGKPKNKQAQVKGDKPADEYQKEIEEAVQILKKLHSPLRSLERVERSLRSTAQLGVRLPLESDRVADLSSPTMHELRGFCQPPKGGCGALT
jgi:hypothetical protein